MFKNLFKKNRVSGNLLENMEGAHNNPLFEGDLLESENPFFEASPTGGSLPIPEDTGGGLKDRARKIYERLQENPPWWQFIKKILVNFILLLIFGIAYAAHVQATKKEDGTSDDWSLPEKSDGASIFFYATSVIHYTIGYGDFYPLSATAKSLTAVHILTTFIVNMYF